MSLAKDASNQNSLVVLPTGLGKTTIALQVIVDYLSKAKGGVLFLAPTRVLVNQHYPLSESTRKVQQFFLSCSIANVRLDAIGY